MLPSAFAGGDHYFGGVTWQGRPRNSAGPVTAQCKNDKPALYTIQTESGKTNYAGVAKRGRVSDANTVCWTIWN